MEGSCNVKFVALTLHPNNLVHRALSFHHLPDKNTLKAVKHTDAKGIVLKI